MHRILCIARSAPVPLGTKGLFVQFSGTANSADTWTVSTPNTQASNYLANSNAYQTALQNRTQAVSTAQTAIDSASSALQQEQAQLALKEAAARPEDGQGAQAQIDTARAALESAKVTQANN